MWALAELPYPVFIPFIRLKGIVATNEMNFDLAPELPGILKIKGADIWIKIFS